jgi:hypothetical protein
MRLLGFGVNNLTDSVATEQQFFDQADRERQQDLDRVAD